MIITSTGDATVASANIQLPRYPVDRQKIKIVSLPIITSANVWAADGLTVRNVASNKFTGNSAVSLTYMSGFGTWFIS
jgi:hypothetical protein